MAVDLALLLDELAAEGDELDFLVGGLSAAGWAAPTPAEGWTIAHQVAHLAWTDEAALAAAAVVAGEPAGWQAVIQAALADPEHFTDSTAAQGAAEGPDALLSRWRAGRRALAAALAAVPAGGRLPWFGPPMSAASMASARLMETWAHGLDIGDALGVARPAGPRLRHVAHLAVRARDFAYVNRGLLPPEQPFLVELTTEEGELLSWGPADAEQRVTGPLLDFCLLVIRRRHRADLAVRAVGEQADQWLDIAQAYAGPPAEARPARRP